MENFCDGVAKSGGCEIQVWTGYPPSARGWQRPQLIATLDVAERDRSVKSRTLGNRRAYLYLLARVLGARPVQPPSKFGPIRRLLNIKATGLY